MVERIATSRVLIDQARLLTLHAAWRMDTVGNEAVRTEIAEIKVAAPEMACQVIDWAIQAHGGGGVTEDVRLAEFYAHARTLRIVDGPDEVHRHQLGRMELAKHAPPKPAAAVRRPQPAKTGAGTPLPRVSGGGQGVGGSRVLSQPTPTSYWPRQVLTHSMHLLPAAPGWKRGSGCPRPGGEGENSFGAVRRSPRYPLYLLLLALFR
jgi:hypothetical protein